MNSSKHNEQSKSVTPDDILKLLDWLYEQSITGIGPLKSPSVYKMADDYLGRYHDPEIACKKMLNNQIKKCTTSGVITGFGGVITLPVAIPANISSVLYVQMRMVACVACLAGLDLNSDQVQTFVYSCLAGVSVAGAAKQAGIKFGTKFATKTIEKIPGKTLVKINQRIGFRFITKFGETGIINLGKLVPGVGAIVNGGFDLVETKIIADRAYKLFFEGEFLTEQDNESSLNSDQSESGDDDN